MMSREQALRAELEELEAIGLSEFDPGLFSAVQSLVDRAGTLPEGARGRLEERAADYLKEFHRARNLQRESAASAMERVEEGEEKSPVKEAFEKGDFRGAIRLSRRVEFKRQRVSCVALPAEVSLKEHIEGRRDVAQLNLRAELEEQLAMPFLYSTSEAGGESEEMLSFQLFREVAADERAGKELGRATCEAPENPGPLNGYALTTETLEHIRNLSPVYLKRFITWLDGLAALYALPESNSRS